MGKTSAKKKYAWWQYVLSYSIIAVILGGLIFFGMLAILRGSPIENADKTTFREVLEASGYTVTEYETSVSWVNYTEHLVATNPDQTITFVFSRHQNTDYAIRGFENFQGTFIPEKTGLSIISGTTQSSPRIEGLTFWHTYDNFTGEQGGYYFAVYRYAQKNVAVVAPAEKKSEVESIIKEWN